jgi:glutaconate CoA-transferase subunit B
MGSESIPVDYTPAEMMTAVAARELRDGEVVFVGIGLPNLACNLARATHAPNLVLIYESGAVGAVPERLPVSIGDPALVTGSLMVCGMADVFQSLLQNGRIEVGFLGGAQIDRYGNINTTVIGPYDKPTVRLPGSGGAAEIAIHARRTVVVSRLDRRAYPEAVDFVTSPGHRCKGRTRQELGMPGAGPTRVVTDKAILEAEPVEGELVLAALYPGVHQDEVTAGVGWALRCRKHLASVDPPTERELYLLREVLDPQSLYLKR